jgi:alkyl hydroperoxide reductase subunit AhpC
MAKSLTASTCLGHQRQIRPGVLLPAGLHLRLPVRADRLDNRIPDFQARNVEVVGVSIDSHFTHNAWRNTPVNNGGIGQVKYTMAADMKHEIAKAYDVESEGGVAFRGAFLIDTTALSARRSSTTCHWAVTWKS